MCILHPLLVGIQAHPESRNALARHFIRILEVEIIPAKTPWPLRRCQCEWLPQKMSADDANPPLSQAPPSHANVLQETSPVASGVQADVQELLRTSSVGSGIMIPSDKILQSIIPFKNPRITRVLRLPNYPNTAEDAADLLGIARGFRDILSKTCRRTRAPPGSARIAGIEPPTPEPANRRGSYGGPTQIAGAFSDGNGKTSGIRSRYWSRS